ncbi:unnamed protein product, partial [marine sediment metagenome]
SREGTPSEGKTTFTNIAVVGLEKDGTTIIATPGVPGYIEMTSCNGNVYYLYIDYEGYLCLASEEIVGHGASPAVLDWAGRLGSGVVVGTQGTLYQGGF